VTEKNRNMKDLTPREWAVLVPTIAIAILMGVVPGLFLKPMEPSVAKVIDRVNGSQPARVENRTIGDPASVPANGEPRPANSEPRPLGVAQGRPEPVEGRTAINEVRVR
jgi:hypothetical protein